MKRITAWIALVFMSIFTVTLVIYLSVPNLLDGRFVMLPSSTGIFGFILFIVLIIDRKKTRLEEVQNKLEEEQSKEYRQEQDTTKE